MRSDPVAEQTPYTALALVLAALKLRPYKLSDHISYERYKSRAEYYKYNDLYEKKRYRSGYSQKRYQQYKHARDGKSNNYSCDPDHKIF